jgi:hypothetical protein
MDPAQAALTAGSTADATAPTHAPLDLDFVHALPPRRGMARVRFAPTAMADAIAALSDEPSTIQRVTAPCEPAIEHAPAERHEAELAGHTTEMLEASNVNDASPSLPPHARPADAVQPDIAPSWPRLDEVSDEISGELQCEQHLETAVIASAPEQAPLDQRAADTIGEAALEDLRLRPAVAALEQAYIAAAMTRTRGNQTQAARLLGLSRFGLQKKLRRLADGGHGDGDGDDAERSVSCTSA